MRAMIRRLLTALAVAALTAIAAQAQEKKETPRGLGDGIKVHGHWTIEAKNPDGTLASHTEFENDLLPDGAAELSKLLVHTDTAFGWGIVIDAANVTAPCLGRCFIVEPAVATVLSGFNNQSVTVAAPTSGPDAGAIVLTGRVQAQNASQVAYVATALITQYPCTSGSSCYSTTFFTGTLLKTPIYGIYAGLVIDVTVVLSFS